MPQLSPMMWWFFPILMMLFFLCMMSVVVFNCDSESNKKEELGELKLFMMWY